METSIDGMRVLSFALIVYLFKLSYISDKA